MNDTETMENFLIERVEPLVENMAGAMEPLAVSMTALADDTREVLNQAQEQVNRQTREWTDQQRTMAANWEQVTKQLERQAQAAQRASRGVTWRMWVMVLGAALIVSVVAPSVFTLWQRSYSKSAVQMEKAANNWQWVLERRQELSTKDRQTVDSLLGLREDQ